jgi:ATP-binding cassette subfamily F protein uup
LILGQIQNYKGKIDISENVEFNYVDQSRILLNDEDTVIKAIGEGSESIKFGNSQISIWTYLRRFLFTDDRINTFVGRLSGGERSRLMLAKILKKGGNFLILDEPTNDLDLPTLRILEEAIINFDGCIVVVSHDRYFLNRICNGILAIEEDGKTFFNEGNYDYYLEKKAIRNKENEQPKAVIKKEDTRIKPSVKKLTWKENKELETMEENILAAEAEVERIEAIFTAPDYHIKYAAMTNELTAELNQAKEKADQLYKRWEELEAIKRGE